MKNLFFTSLFSAIILISCGKDKPLTSESHEVTTSKNGSLYTLDTLNSKVEWKGYKILKSDNTSHFGTLKFESGDVTVNDGKLESGKFVVDMSSLENVDLATETEQKNKLEAHLKSADFFATEKFPTASYEITKVSPLGTGDYNTSLDGNLTVKGITKPVKFNANVSVHNDLVSISTEPTDVNRQDFGVKFAIPAQNGILNNEITLQISVKALEKK